MFGRSFPLFRVLGFQIGAHWTLAVALALAAYGNGLLLSVLLFASILAHELGHAVVARGRGVPIAGIDLHMFGGVAKMAAPPKSPDDEIAIALAGPAVSLMLAGAAYLLRGWSPLLAYVASANLMLGLFNLLPALPLDGGRVFRAWISKRRGLVDGTRIAVKVARVLAVGIAVFGVLTNPWLIGLAALVWVMGTAELANVVRGGWVRYEGAARAPRVPDAVL